MFFYLSWYTIIEFYVYVLSIKLCVALLIPGLGLDGMPFNPGVAIEEIQTNHGVVEI